MITSKYQPCASKPTKYPLLKQRGLLIVLFTGYRNGYVVSPTPEKPVGFYSYEWNEDQFTVFDGEVILTNT